MRFRGIGNAASLLKTDYKQATLVLGSEKIVKETIALKVGNDYMALNDDNVEYYSVIAKKGLGLLAGSTATVLFGPLGHAVARAATGSNYVFDGKKKIVFIKLNNGKRLLIQVEEGNMHLIRSRNKVSIENIDQKDENWVQKFLDDISGQNEADSSAETISEESDDSGDDEEEYF